METYFFQDIHLYIYDLGRHADTQTNTEAETQVLLRFFKCGSTTHFEITLRQLTTDIHETQLPSRPNNKDGACQL